MGALERLPEKALSEELKRHIAETAELKGSFQSLGSTSVLTHRIFSDDVYDVQLTASPTPGTVLINQADVTFVPDDNTFGGAFCYRVFVKCFDISNNVIDPAYPVYIERKETTDGSQKWSFYHASFGYPEDTIRLKFYFFTTGSGTFSTTLVT